MSVPFPYTQLEYTPIDTITGGIKNLRQAYQSTHKTHDIQFRLNQLRNLFFAIKENADVIADALFRDFHRSMIETKAIEVAASLDEINQLISNLSEWSQPEVTAPGVFIERIPLGMILVISPFNYPLVLSISPIAGCIASGNAVVFKPSEQLTHFSQVITKILSEALDPDTFFIVNGGVEETTAVLEQKFDKIVFTGSSRVAKLIAAKAAETLTPMVLELGGKSPVIILDDVSDEEIALAAKKIAFGRFVNGGQSCMAADYILCPRDLKSRLVEEFKKVLEGFFPGLDAQHQGFTHIINDTAYSNLCGIIDTTKGKVAIGGSRDAASRFISPTVIEDVDWSDATMAQEIFGPVLPIISYDSLKDAIEGILTHHDCPLAQYIFTGGAIDREHNSRLNSILTAVRSGAVMVNDVVMFVGAPNVPFGGIGASGYGSYRGRFSFRNFTHERTSMVLPLTQEKDQVWAHRYPNLTDSNSQTFNLAAKNMPVPFDVKVNFDRTGDVPLEKDTQ